MRRGRRRNDAPWRNDCIDLYGDWCRNCGAGQCQMDHMIGGAGGRPSVVENGLPLCGPYSEGSPFAGGCHQAKTDGKLKIRREWLTSEQVEWLAVNQFARWDPKTGEVSGRHMKVFADDPRASEQASTGGPGQ